MANLKNENWSCYDYNGVIFVFGRINSDLTEHWNDVFKVTMSVDGQSSFVYSSDIKNIPYRQTENLNGDTCENNVSCKVFNINTFTHKADSNTQYIFGSGTHTCYLRFYYSPSSYESTSVQVKVHASLTTPSVSVDTTNGIINVTRTYAPSDNPYRHYIEIRNSNRRVINTDMSWEDKDYIHTVVMKGTEGGKYNEGIPHTAFMKRGEGNISTSGIRSVREGRSEPEETQPELFEVITFTSVTCDTDIPFTTSGTYRAKQYYKFVAPSNAAYQFKQEDGPDLACYLYSDENLSNYLAGNDDRPDGNRSFNLLYYLRSGQTVYIEICEYCRDVQSINLRINKITSNQSVSSFTPYTIQAHSAVNLTYTAQSGENGYMTLYTAKKAKGIMAESFVMCEGKTPYYTFEIEAGNSYNFPIYNNSDRAITYWLTPVHPEADYQPYWRIHNVPYGSRFDVCVVFDNAEIMEQYGERCIAEVDDAMKRLTDIMSEATGTNVTYEISDQGVQKLYVEESLTADSVSGRYINTGNDRINTDSSKTLYYAAVTGGSVYRVNYGHDRLFFATSHGTNTSVTPVSDSSSYFWYETIGEEYGADENTLVAEDGLSGYYILSNSEFSLEKVRGANDAVCKQAYYDRFRFNFDILVRFGLDGTTWMGDQGIATSADINGQGMWLNWMYYDSSSGVSWSYAIINVDNSDLFETFSHVVHEEIAQSLGMGDDCYSRENSMHWDPEYANPDYYTGIDGIILRFAYEKDRNGYTQFDLLNECDMPAIFFREYTDYQSGYKFRLKDAGGNWLLRPGTYDVYAWCAGQGINGGSQGTSASDGWDDDPYSLRSAPVTFTVPSDGRWYWSDFDIDMRKGLAVSAVLYTVWNDFVENVASVMDQSGTIPNDSGVYGSDAAGQSFASAIAYAKTTSADKTLYAYKFNIVNYIISKTVPTGIGPVTRLEPVKADYMITLQDCRNNM